MKTTERFDKAVTKLYNAFHKGELNAASCSACAVGNIVGHKNWAMICYTDAVAGIKNRYEFGYSPPNFIDYSNDELEQVEFLFLSKSKGINGKKHQFKGLCAVVEYLCELDGIPNVMDYKSLFEYDDLGIVNPIEHLVGATQ